VSDLIAAVNGWSGPWAEALWRACWHGAVALSVVWLVCRAWPRLPASAQCWLWRLAYLKLLLGLVRLPAVVLPVLPAGAAVTVPFATTFDVSPALPAGAALAPAAPLTSQPMLPTFVSIALGLWLFGAAWYASRVVGSWRMAQRLRLACRPLEDAHLGQDLRELCCRNRVGRVPALMVGETERPLLLGIRHPAIVLPAELVSSCGAAEMHLMLAHEVAHLRRRDLAWTWLPVLAEELFYFHPLVWLGRREWRLSQEMACDALAVQTTQRSHSEYGEMLVKVAARPEARRQEFAAVGIVESYQALKRRLTAMAHLAPMTGRRWMVVTAVICLVVVAALIPWRLGAREDGGGQAALAAETGGGGGGWSGGGGGSAQASSAEAAQAAGMEAHRYSWSDLDPKLIRHYQVNRKVSDFPDKEDLSIPERTYSYCNRLLASGDEASWGRISAREGRGGGGAPATEVAPEVARGWLNAPILEVWIYRERFAAVIAKVTLPADSFHDLRFVELRDGRWLNLGESKFRTIELARGDFARFCVVRYPEIILHEETVAHAMDHPEQFARMAQKLFQDIRGADYQYFLASADPDVWLKFPADYCAETGFDRWVNWVCTTFSKNPITDVQLGKVFKGQDDLPVVPYMLTLKDGSALSGNLPFQCSIEQGRAVWQTTTGLCSIDQGRAVWQATTGLDWHLKPGE